MAGPYERAPFFYGPEGRLVQVEFAREVVNRGSTTIGLKTREFVLLSSHVKPTLPLLEPTEKIYSIDDHIGATGSGNIADILTLVDMVRVEAQRHRLAYGGGADVISLAQHLGAYIHGLTLYPVRPLGASIILAGRDGLGLQLIMVDPSGTFARGKAMAIGNNSTAAREILEHGYHEDLSVDDALSLTTRAIAAALREDGPVEHGLVDLERGIFSRLPEALAH